MMNSQETAVSLQSVSHHYGKVRALNDISFSLPRGVTVGLIGPDGVGKSTLLSLIAGVRIIQTGTVDVLGGDMADKAVRQEMSHRIAYMPQGLGKNLYPTLSVYENVDFHARLFGLKAKERKTRIGRLLEATGLAPFPDRAAGKLSGGMKQKLSLCCALVHSPDLLILDEPTTGVDPLSRRQFWSLVNDLLHETSGMTVIVATAYIDEAEQFQHLLAMDDGKLLVNAPTNEVMARYGARTLEEAYVKMLPEEKQQGAGALEITPFIADPNSPPAMEAHNLTKRFGQFTAVDHVSFKIEKGEIFGFLGSNGCGKSTTMKMLTGLLPATEGSAELLGQPINAGNLATRMRVGYMSQAFSLYEELTVRQNLELHAKLYQMGDASAQAVEDALTQFDLSTVADTKPSSLPLGIRQRLQLAAACLHHPEVLILDEPTSGVDPAARDMFWRTLLKLSRQDRITIFVSTHFMNEVDRCDRISLMHRGRVLAVGTPKEVVEKSGKENTEEAFIYYLEQDAVREAQEEGLSEKAVPAPTLPIENEKANLFEQTAASASDPQQQTTGLSLSEKSIGDKQRRTRSLKYWFSTVRTFAAREAKELLRDRIRLFFAAFGPVIMLASIGWAISFDVNELKYAVLDHDQSSESRRVVEYFRGSSYFQEMPPPAGLRNAEAMLKSHRVSLVLDIPAGFGRRASQVEQPEIGVYIDGVEPFNAAAISNYVSAIMNSYNKEVLKERGIELPTYAELAPRFMYNQDFKSVNAVTPNVIMLVLMMIPAIMTALSVVREREIGSIANLYASPAAVSQYLIGKQIPYLVIGLFNFAILSMMLVLWFGVPLKGSLIALVLGSLLYTSSSTALGLLISSFTKSQTAAFFIASLGTMIPTINFSGMKYPVSSMSGGAYVMGMGFPASWFQRISMGGFTKGLGITDFATEYAALAAFGTAYLLLACILLKKQEK
ncbi:MAG: ribosome-associated ATPase/putative transporter RbbA [Neisseria sp.]|uniref:ribosome-associated ATPase/putative transporter RbbA n=1 Tax=Neisseria sp. TaxID=192066 RepID=UPI0026DD8288|nr:ribosome-associated ATPase/putative transporter RbbA [Neisseria sp.]MDO4640240.1 ribosome-associated ATPase/putative transporter RbbA [Neisseria sp.]